MSKTKHKYNVGDNVWVRGKIYDKAKDGTYGIEWPTNPMITIVKEDQIVVEIPNTCERKEPLIEVEKIMVKDHCVGIGLDGHNIYDNSKYDEMEEE